MSKWIRDTSLEQSFKDLEIEFVWQDRIKISDIDIKKSLKNNARMGLQLDEEHVEKISLAIKENNLIPGVMLQKVGNKFIIIGGNHRVASAIAVGLKTIGGYIITCEDDEAEILTRSDNRKHGKGQDNKESDEHIYFLYTKYKDKWSIAALAKKFLISVQHVQNIVLAKTLREEFAESSVNVDNMSTSAILALNPIRMNKDVFLRAGHLAATHKLSSVIITDMAKQIKAGRSQLSQQIIVEDWEKELSKTKKPVLKRNHSAKTKFCNLIVNRPGLLTLLKTGKKGKPITSINDLSLSIAEAEDLLEKWKEIEGFMKPLLNECRTWSRQHKSKAAK